MTINITLTPDEEYKLDLLARSSGKEPEVYIHDVVTAFLNKFQPGATKTFEEILEPIWDGWQRSGLTEHEVDDLLRSELEDVRRERRQGKGRSE